MTAMEVELSWPTCNSEHTTKERAGEHVDGSPRCAQFTSITNKLVLNVNACSSPVPSLRCDELPI